MDFKKIINSIDEFYSTADDATLARVNAAFSVDIKGDVSLEEYISGFDDEYFYTEDDDSNCYVSESIGILNNINHYLVGEFESAPLVYHIQDSVKTRKVESEHSRDIVDLIKAAA